MLEVKMPEPFIQYEGAKPMYTEAQLKACGDDRALAALKEAAYIAESEPQEQSADGSYVCTPATIARAICALAKEIK